MKRVHGIVLMGVGAVLIVVGIVGLLSGGDDDAPEAATTTTAAATTTVAATTTSTVPSMPEPDSNVVEDDAATENEATTTTQSLAEPNSNLAEGEATTTTTTTLPAETVEAFIEAYALAAEADDVDFLFDRLHPVVLARSDPDQCRAFIAADIVALEDYRLNGPVAGPRSVTFDTPAGTVTVDELYEAPVAFVFRGESFDVVAAFAPVNGQMRWLTECE